ncbi:MAG: hypothetical protein HZB41_07140 [Ignavibacteriae bacterium]|nr:hypothetical protein [Ignavibacteriota bacterium]
MISEIIKNCLMNSNFETEWFPIQYELPNDGIKSASSVQVSWKDVTGTLDGTIEIIASVDQVMESIGCTLNINSDYNVSDSEMFLLYPSFNYIKLKFTKNGITGGMMNAVIQYE